MQQIFIKTKRNRTHQEDRHLALLLATAAGLLNAMALGAYGFFPSHMSGNTSQIPTEVSSSDFRDLLILAAIIVAFVVGSVTSRLLVISGIKNNIRTIFSLILFTEGVALVLLSLFELLFYSSRHSSEVIVLLGFLMGIHNATSTQLSNGRVRSTHITGTLTDAGIALGSVLSSLMRRDFSKDSKAHRSQLFTHLVTISSFLAGGICGLLLFKLYSFTAMLAVGAFLALVALSSVTLTLLIAKKRLLKPWVL